MRKVTMKGRETKKGTPPTDLLVCFPTLAHLTLLPKAICSPGRQPEPKKRRHNHQQNHHLMKKSTTRAGSQASPLLWAKTKPNGSDISEPTSPKVTCAGQIKVRPKINTCKSWQLVMEEIEKIHNNKIKHKNNKRLNWVELLGFKIEIMQFLTCLRSIRFSCFRTFPESDITSSYEEDDVEEEKDHFPGKSHVGIGEIDRNEASGTVFSKWFMVLQENQTNGFCKENSREDGHDVSVREPIAPPPNALLLMRCRSAPAKSWLEEKEFEQCEVDNADEDEEYQKVREKGVNRRNSLKSLMEEEERSAKKKENLVVMKYDESDLYKMSEIAKETWIVGGLSRDSLSRSRSWKR